MTVGSRLNNDDSFLSRVHSLLQHSLPRSSTDFELNSLTKDEEKELLVSLSQVFNLIRRYADEHQQSSCNRSVDSSCVDDEILTEIVAKLVLLVNAKSRYVRHLVGNIFLVLSEFLLVHGRNWDKFIQSLCVCFEFTMCKILQHSPQSVMKETDVPLVSYLIADLDVSSWHGIAEITRILRVVVKQLKDKDDAELVGVMLNSFSNCLTKVPWDLLKNIHNDRSTEVGGFVGEKEAEILFFGNLVQLLCSTVGLIGFAEGAASQYESDILLEAYDHVPKFLDWCHSGNWSHILPYFRHKILMLMIKLSFRMQLGCSNLNLWLELLKKYYQDLLSGPISQLECRQDDSLEGSPFLLALDDWDVCHLSSCHVQRKAIFFFLRCSLSLISLRKTANFKCTCMRSISSRGSDLNTEEDCSSGKKGLFEFYGWLRGHAPSITFSESEVNLDCCINFASTFIRFFMQEDDVLFEVLLLLLTIPSWAERLFSKQERACHITEEDILYHISNLFNPLLLFHVFLAELQYDHQLLLDYLISKDIGGKCAEYLLKCLRIVCDSWNLFVKYSVRENVVYQSKRHRTCKRRRESLSDISEEQIHIPLHGELAMTSKSHLGECKLGSNGFGTRFLQVESAKECLLSLKSALRKLHRRKLFPYNPEVLIRRNFSMSRAMFIHTSIQCSTGTALSSLDNNAMKLAKFRSTCRRYELQLPSC